MLSRRTFLATTLGPALLAGCVKPRAAGRRRPPFRLLYGNDTTHVTSCVSPYHRKGEPFRPEMLEASVDEAAAAGADAQFLQPGLGWVPMWPSKVVPPAEHYAWIRQRYGLEPDTFGRHVLSGGDVVRDFVGRCRARGQAAFVSFRLNDVHHKEFAGAKPGEKIGGGAAMSLTRFFVEHPEYRIGPDAANALQRVQNWAVPEVRAHKFAMLRELCGNYDLDGLELDFLRFHSLFPQDRTTSAQRRDIMTGFVRQVRDLLDRTARGGRRRWLCARVPCYLKGHDPLGIDLPGMAAAGLDMVNVSASYFTVQQSDFAAIRQSVPDAAVYLELCHSIWNGQKIRPGYDTFTFRRTTREQFCTAAHHAYARGADGVSAFNFVYYREHGGPERGPFHEPPFGVLARLRDPAWLARQPQHWFLAPGWDNPFIRPPLLPRKIQPGVPASFALDLAPPSGGWKKGGRLRLQAESSLDGSAWRLRLNGTELAASTNLSEPYGNPYTPMLGRPEQLRAWQVPASLLRDGVNRIEAAMPAGEPSRVMLLDLGIE